MAHVRLREPAGRPAAAPGKTSWYRSGGWGGGAARQRSAGQPPGASIRAIGKRTRRGRGLGGGVQVHEHTYVVANMTAIRKHDSHRTPYYYALLRLRFATVPR